MKPEIVPGSVPGSAEPQLGNNDTSRIADASAHYRVERQLLDVPPGYKRTEVGVIPEDWEVRSIREIGQIKTGPFGTLLKAEEYSGTDGVPLISVGEIANGSFDVSELTPRVPEHVVRRLPQYVLRCGDIVFGRKGAVDRSALVTDTEDGWFLGSDGMSIRPLKSCFPQYLAWQFQRYEVQQWLLQNAIGTTMASLNQGILSRIRVPYALPLEQRAIAEALSDVDGLLGALEALIAKKRAIKQAAMQQLLTGKTRLPGFSGPWETLSLGDLERRGGIKLYRGKVISQKDIDRSPGNYPIYSSSVHSNGLFGCYGKYMFDEELITWSVDGGGHFFYRPKHRFSVTNVCGYMRIRTASIDCRYLAYQLQELHSRKFFDYTLKAHPSVIRSSYHVALPESAEQTAIATVLSDMDAKIAALERRRDKTRAFKQGMMQQLLTGRVRLL